MRKLTVIPNLFDQSTWQTVETDDICAELQKRYSEFPHTARIYVDKVSLDNDVTPRTQADIDALQEMDGEFYAVVYPGDPVTLLYIAYAIVAIVVIVAITNKPKTPTATSRNYQSQSPNNALSGRTNQARLNNRIPDIYGTVRSTPDLLAVPYSIFKDHVEYEYCYMCIGRGQFYIDETTIRDGQTPATSIDGESVQVYLPNTSPNTGDAPQIAIGPTIDRPVIAAVRSKSVNGQTLLAVNDSPARLTSTEIAFGFPHWIVTDSPTIDFTDDFSAGQTLTITAGGTIWTGSIGNPEDGITLAQYINVSGTYVIDSVIAKSIKLVDPAAINPGPGYVGPYGNGGWLTLQYTGQTVPYGYIGYGVGVSQSNTTLLASSTSFDNWVGPFVLDVTTMDQIICNFVALNGMYKDDGTNQLATSVDIQVGATPCTVAGVATGSETFFTVTVEGSSNTTGSRAATLFGDLLTPGRYMVRAQRLTPLDLTFSGQISDEVKWRDLYASSPVGNVHFGNVTTVHAVTQATREALAVSERQLNMLVTRMLPVFNYGANSFSGLAATNKFADAMSAIALDPKIGNRPASEVDFRNLYDVHDEITAYFGTVLAAEFSYTFDSDNLTFEEILSSIAEAVFCKALRRGRVIEVQFEKQTEDSMLLFNHRNKVPGSEQRTANFGQSNNNDGIEYDYVSPIDDAIVKFYVPEDRSAVNPVKIESIGIRSATQAYLHAYREYNKLRFKTRSVSFDATQESELVSVGNRILVADNSRPDTQDGEVEAQDGPVLTLSQPISIVGGSDYVVFLQLSNGSVEIVPCTWGDTRYKITLLSTPSLPLVVDDAAFVKTLYQVVKADDVNKGNNKAFLIEEKNPNGNFVNTISACNYDDRYYQNDQDFVV